MAITGGSGGNGLIADDCIKGLYSCVLVNDSIQVISLLQDLFGDNILT